MAATCWHRVAVAAVLTAWLQFAAAASPPPAPVLFVIQSQHTEFHRRLAEKTRNSILSQWDKLVPATVMDPPKILLTADLEDGLDETAWTIFPLIEMIQNKMWLEKQDWVAIINENTEINLKNLIGYFQQKKDLLKPREESLFFGKALKDEEPVIIHHFDNPDQVPISFPDLDLGIYFSSKLVFSLHERLRKGRGGAPNFQIDPAYEFAKFLHTELAVSLTDVPGGFCSQEPKNKVSHCIAYPRQKEYLCIKKKNPEEVLQQLESTRIAVKTCVQYQTERLPAITSTWAPLVPHLDFVSEVADPAVPTIHLPYTINTEKGHCNKTLAILHNFLENDNRQWLVIVDDDTILSPTRLAQLLGCYNAEDGPVILGQRYGYSTEAAYGYNYITGGAGMAFNRMAVAKLLGSADGCACPKPDTPDDMHLGMCAKKLKIPLLHSGRMFQARPNDYPAALVSFRKPVSFHKHWNNDPVQVYEEWFRKVDKPLADLREASRTRDEL